MTTVLPLYWASVCSLPSRSFSAKFGASSPTLALTMPSAIGAAIAGVDPFGASAALGAPATGFDGPADEDTGAGAGGAGSSDWLRHPATASAKSAGTSKRLGFIMLILSTLLG